MNVPLYILISPPPFSALKGLEQSFAIAFALHPCLCIGLQYTQVYYLLPCLISDARREFGQCRTILQFKHVSEGHVSAVSSVSASQPCAWMGTRSVELGDHLCVSRQVPYSTVYCLLQGDCDGEEKILRHEYGLRTFYYLVAACSRY